jgi:hypothetical protein
MKRQLRRTLRRLTSPRTWQVSVRRIFLIGLPVTVPLWLAALLGVLIASAIHDFMRPVREFWTAPPRQLTYRSSLYDYNPPRNNVTLLEVDQELRDAA